MSEGFMGRWSRRKLDVKEGKEVEAEPVVPEPQPPAELAPLDQAFAEQALAEQALAEQALPDPVPPEPPPLTLADTESLTPASDFTRFVRPGVSPAVTNAAMKKLFADPHFNVMDRMDTYIDDYSQSTPIPESVLRELTAGKFLKLFEVNEDAEAEPAPGTRDDADDPAPQSVAQSSPTAPEAVPQSTDHADPDLRLQQDDAAAGEDPGRGAR